MHVLTKVIEYSGDPTFTIYPIGDAHIGTVHHDRKVFLSDIQAIANDPNALWVEMGDAAECISLSDPRFMADEIDKRFLPYLGTLAVKQRDAFIEDVKPIASKCIAVMEGNHCFELRRRHYVDIAHDIARELDTPYLGDTAFVRIVFRKMDEGKRIKSTNLMLYLEHGSCGGTTTGAVVNYIERLMNSFEADLYFTAHTHKRAWLERPILRIPGQGQAHIVDRKRLGVCTGSYYTTYTEGHSSYGQRKHYAPTALGTVPVQFRPSNAYLGIATNETLGV